jgi:hypothetical protein
MLNQVLLDREELEVRFPSHRFPSPVDLHHIPTARLEALADKYRRRALVSPNDKGLQMRIQFILSEIGMRQMVADIERDVETE